MTERLPPFRRIVTGFALDGRSTIVEDGPPPVIRESPVQPDLKNANIWVTRATPAPIDAPDTVAEHNLLYPPANGSVIRVMDIPPQPKSREEAEKAYDSTRGSMFPDRDKVQGDTSKHAGMHITDTVDYAICLFGEIYAVMEDGETLMKAGDVLVQRGTNHAWSNRSDGICRMAFILIDGRRV